MRFRSKLYRFSSCFGFVVFQSEKIGVRFNLLLDLVLPLLEDDILRRLEESVRIEKKWNRNI